MLAGAKSDDNGEHFVTLIFSHIVRTGYFNIFCLCFVCMYTYCCFHTPLPSSFMSLNSFIRARAFGLHLELFMESVFLLIIPITVHFQQCSLEKIPLLFRGCEWGFFCCSYWMFCSVCSVKFVSMIMITRTILRY